MARLIGKEIIDELEVKIQIVTAIISVGAQSRTYEPDRNHQRDSREKNSK